MEELAIAIIGLGLMGGSLGLELSSWPRTKFIKGYDIDRKAAEKAKELGAVNFISPSLEEAAQGVDLVFISSGYECASCLLELRPHLSPSTRVLDLGSTREWVWGEISPALQGLSIQVFILWGVGRGWNRTCQKGILRNVPILVSPPPASKSGKNMVEEIARFLEGQVFF